MNTPAWLHFFQRTFPSANMVLIRGTQPILIDTGFGSDLAETEQLLHQAGVPPPQLTLIANTHYHCDHVGGNYGLQQHYHLPIAAHPWEAKPINQRDPEACSANYLGQPIQPYRVTRFLNEGDTLDAGGVILKVLHTPGHSLGHLSFYAPDDQVLICGDCVHGDDVSWINIFREGTGAIYRLLENLERFTRLPVRLACSGHGALITDPQAAFAAAIDRYTRWLDDPTKIGWHACKRIFSYALMIENGLAADDIAPYLLKLPWFHDFSRWMLHTDPAVFVQPLIEEVIRAGAARWEGDRLVCATAFNPPQPHWYGEIPTRPHQWDK